jgi:hypothetical protein
MAFSVGRPSDGGGGFGRGIGGARQARNPSDPDDLYYDQSPSAHYAAPNAPQQGGNYDQKQGGSGFGSKGRGAFAGDRAALRAERLANRPAGAGNGGQNNPSPWLPLPQNEPVRPSYMGGPNSDYPDMPQPHVAPIVKNQPMGQPGQAGPDQTAIIGVLNNLLGGGQPPQPIGTPANQQPAPPTSFSFPR